MHCVLDFNCSKCEQKNLMFQCYVCKPKPWICSMFGDAQYPLVHSPNVRPVLEKATKQVSSRTALRVHSSGFKKQNSRTFSFLLLIPAHSFQQHNAELTVFGKLQTELTSSGAGPLRVTRFNIITDFQSYSWRYSRPGWF